MGGESVDGIFQQSFFPTKYVADDDIAVQFAEEVVESTKGFLEKDD